MADGTTKPIEQIQPGDLVLSAPEHNPEAPVEAKPVVEVYHNKPSRLLNLHIDGSLIRCTLNHPFYVREKGWTHASDLAIGAQLRTHNGEWVEVTNRSVSDDIQPVFNLQVNDHHTYFVVTDKGASVLIHNDSAKVLVELEIVILAEAGSQFDNVAIPTPCGTPKKTEAHNHFEAFQAEVKRDARAATIAPLELSLTEALNDGRVTHKEAQRLEFTDRELREVLGDRY